MTDKTNNNKTITIVSHDTKGDWYDESVSRWVLIHELSTALSKRLPPPPYSNVLNFSNQK